jgi:hypothetical protein
MTFHTGSTQLQATLRELRTLILPWVFGLHDVGHEELGKSMKRGEHFNTIYKTGQAAEMQAFGGMFLAISLSEGIN